ncbi:MAG: gliding motility-associated C-terminal domain-containing protein [Bacteroidetes bacterium]|nr:gliding motility-associated C-terminal domain-containing protein [Bacteroidota bacterium]
MKKYTIVLLLSCINFCYNAQVVTCLGNDVTICQGQNVTINNCPNSGSNSSNIALNNPSPVILSDDNWSAPVNIGFPFSFYGVSYTQCVVGSNGIVSFNVANAGGPCPWTLNGTPLPTTTIPNAQNTAMMCYQDLNPTNASSGPVQTQTIGTAPNRKFVVLYNGVTMFSCTQSCAYIGMVFHEGTNIIDYYIGYKGQCATWNNGRAIQGIENSSATLAHITPGRNNSVWSANQDAKRYTPTSPTNTNNYAITNIPYQSIIAAGGAFQWKSTLGQIFPYNNGVLTINQVPPGKTGYFLVGSACGNPIGTASDTTFVTRTNATVSVTSSPAVCGTPSGTATATPLTGTAPFLFNWPSISQNSQTALNLLPGTYAVIITDVNGCTGTATTTIQNIAATFSGDSTEVSCAGGADGTVTAHITPSGNLTTYLWNDSQNQITQTATGLNAGTYDCLITSDNGCIGSVTVVVTEIPALEANITNKADITCHSKNDGFIEITASNGTGPYNYNWSGSTTNTNNTNDLYAGKQDITITDAKGCTVLISTFLDEPLALQMNYITPDTTICSESSITLSANGTGGSSSYTYSWYENGIFKATGSSILVDPLNSGTLYNVELSEACGSPVANDSVLIDFPLTIEPVIVPNKPQGCAPDVFTFYNQSTNSADISSIYYSFTNGKNYTKSASDSVTSYFSVPDSYDLDVLVTSVYGCIYQKNFIGIIKAIERPKARFLTSANPTSIFETKIELIDKSVDAVQWEWFVPGASPEFGETKEFNTEFPSLEGTYPMYLKVTSSEGCTDSVQMLMVVESDLIFYTPNAFTPDGDQFNNTWKFVTGGIDVYNFELQVYDRWGKILWTTQDPSLEWDGTFNGNPLQQGTYSYVAKMQERNKENPRIVKGTINLIR